MLAIGALSLFLLMYVAVALVTMVPGIALRLPSTKLDASHEARTARITLNET